MPGSGNRTTLTVPTSRQLYEQGIAAIEASLVVGRAETAAAETRVARLKHALALEQCGWLDDARAIYTQLADERETAA